jgi:hypothetical protein
MNFRDIVLLVQKIIVGIVIFLIPFLIFFAGLRLVRYMPKGRNPTPGSSCIPKNPIKS